MGGCLAPYLPAPTAVGLSGDRCGQGAGLGWASAVIGLGGWPKSWVAGGINGRRGGKEGGSWMALDCDSKGRGKIPSSSARSPQSPLRRSPRPSSYRPSGWGCLPEAAQESCCSSACRVRSKSGSEALVWLTFSTEYMTVEWCLSLKSLPISG